MSECLPTVIDIESVDGRMTGSQPLSNESDEVLLNLVYLLHFHNFNVDNILLWMFWLKWASKSNRWTI